MENPGKSYDQIKKLAFFAVALGESLRDASKATTTVGKAAAFLTSLDEAADLITINTGELKTQFQAMDDAEWYALCKECEAHFSLSDADLETKVEASVNAGFKILAAAREAMDIWKK